VNSGYVEGWLDVKGSAERSGRDGMSLVRGKRTWQGPRLPAKDRHGLVAEWDLVLCLVRLALPIFCAWLHPSPW
jgi:hypothetical protein